uniref:Uncharacterized protein n=1 Tax=Rhizophora mucronata TaxID=61149 RepID=A0A2P2P9Z7_RHIMU
MKQQNNSKVMEQQFYYTR